MRNGLKIVLVGVVLAALEAAAWAQGCSMCRSALESSPEGKILASSFAQGILMMLFLPYAIVGTFAYFIYRAFRKKINSVSDVSGTDQPRSY